MLRLPEHGEVFILPSLPFGKCVGYNPDSSQLPPIGSGSFMHFQTKSVHGGVHKDQQYNSVTTPIYPSSTFYWTGLETNCGYDYTRSSNPTRTALEENLAALEGGVGCAATSSGMSAIYCAISLFSPGDHLVVPKDVYGGTFRLFEKYLSGKGLSFSFVDMTNLDETREAITPSTKC